MNISTNIKISIAKGMYQTIKALHLYPGKNPKNVSCRRDGINWNLDLSEGIDLAIFTFGKFEATTSQLFKKIVKPGMTVFDIGANVGAHALPLAKLVGPDGKVFAFEPTAWAMQKLKKNLSLNPELNKSLIMHQAFVGSSLNSKPIDQVYASWSLDEKDTDPVHGGVAFGINEASTVTIDDFVSKNNISRVDLFKVDVDGFEIEVMRGSVQTLKKFRPSILIELCPHIFERYNFKMEELIEFFKENNYSLYNLSMTKKYPLDENLFKYIPKDGSINAIAMAN